MIPLVGNVKELAHQEKIVRRVAAEVMKEKGVKFQYLVGTMIEIPRGALTADEIATVAEFFSFGTNDLTQTTLGVSRDDAARFLIPYVEKEIFPKDPFEVLDRVGVGSLMKIAIEKGRSVRSGSEDRHLRRTRRRTVERRVLPPDRPELRELLAVPRADRATGSRPRGPGGCGGEGEDKPPREGRPAKGRRSGKSKHSLLHDRASRSAGTRGSEYHHQGVYAA